ncbi:MAG: hypothetical protein GEV07_29975 [Streptosporangiales bacterium]|nr:hypothetical protein [Streptosporangiales bacterium]
MSRRRTEDEITVDLEALVAGTIALARVTVGVTAMCFPTALARPWVGEETASDPNVRTLSRALGARDLALGAGALRALALRGAGEPGAEAAYWVAAGGMCDAADAAVTVLGWRKLSRAGRWFVFAAASGAAVAGLAVGHRLKHS